MKRSLACLIIAGTFTFGTSMIASAALSVPSSVQTSQSTYKRSATITQFAATDIATHAADAGLRAATATRLLVLRSV